MKFQKSLNYAVIFEYQTKWLKSDCSNDRIYYKKYIDKNCENKFGESKLEVRKKSKPNNFRYQFAATKVIQQFSFDSEQVNIQKIDWKLWTFLRPLVPNGIYFSFLLNWYADYNMANISGTLPNAKTNK